MDDLVKWNKIKNYTIHPGQVLTIQTIVSTPAKPAITKTPKVEAKPAITTTPKVESKPGVTTTPKVDEKPAITTTPKVEEQPVVTTVPKTESEVLVEKAIGVEKSVEIVKDSKIPTTHTPNSIIRRVDNYGKLISERIFGPDGRAVKDIHYTDHGNPKQHPKVPHEHIWDWSNPKNPKPGK